MPGKRDHGDGGITQRGEGVWRLRWRVGAKRHSKTLEGTKRAAQQELRRLLASADAGGHVAPDKITLGAYLRGWIETDPNLGGQTRDRYLDHYKHQIAPFIGGIRLQQLRPKDIADWHGALLQRGSAKGRPLTASTVRRAHGMLSHGLSRTEKLELVVKNVARSVRPPRVDDEEISILSPEQVGELLAGLEGHPLHVIAAVALSTGLRRGELCGLQWGDVDFGAGVLRVERSVEQTSAGIRVKSPKSRAGRRTVSLAKTTADLLRAHRARQSELWLQLGLGRLADTDPVFTGLDGHAWPPDTLSRRWWGTVRSHKLPLVKFHALRHGYASMMIAAGLDVVDVSRRLGHSKPGITLNVYAHLFGNKDDVANAAIDAVLGPNLVPTRRE